LPASISFAIANCHTTRNCCGVRIAERLVARLHTLRRTVDPNQNWLREQSATYETEPEDDEAQDG
jgi:hypothetical protein